MSSSPANSLTHFPSAVIRPATPEMAPIAAELIYLTMGVVADYLFGADDAERARAVMGRMFRLRRNLFSFEFADVVMLGEKPAGLVVTFPVKTMQSLELPTAYQLARTSGLAALLRMLIRSRPLAGVKEAEDDEYFVPHLAVLPEFQGRGLGKILLAGAESKAKQAGFATIALTVEVNNERAISLYASQGFDIVETCSFPSLNKRIGYNGFHRMAKNLP